MALGAFIGIFHKHDGCIFTPSYQGTNLFSPLPTLLRGQLSVDSDSAPRLAC